MAERTAAPAAQVRAAAVGATTLRIQLHHDTGTPPAPLGLQLFDRSQGLLTAELVDSAEFSAVRLAESTIPGGNSTLTVTGGGSQSAPVGQPFPSTMTAIVRDENDNPVPDTLVTLTVPAEGASASLHAGMKSRRVIVAFTDASGLIAFTSEANPIAGCFKVIGEVAGISMLATFHLRNHSPPQIAAYRAAHPGSQRTAAGFRVLQRV